VDRESLSERDLDLVDEPDACVVVHGARVTGGADEEGAKDEGDPYEEGGELRTLVRRRPKSTV